jgi:hypothetical protein
MAAVVAMVVIQEVVLQMALRLQRILLKPFLHPHTGSRKQLKPFLHPHTSSRKQTTGMLLLMEGSIQLRHSLTVSRKRTLLWAH